MILLNKFYPQLFNQNVYKHYQEFFNSIPNNVIYHEQILLIIHLVNNFLDHYS